MDKQQRELILETMETVLELELRAIRQALGTDEPQVGAVRQRGRKRKSLTDLSVELLTGEQHPLHVDELVDLLREHYGRVTDRDSLSSALAKKAKQGILVRRVSPATFELLI
ncbi:MAG: hypothetical protein K8R75_03685 [Deltaproteobacteria bacterium]|nr:hypothetical protein [Deltaproteobacteria bacterium]